MATDDLDDINSKTLDMQKNAIKRFNFNRLETYLSARKLGARSENRTRSFSLEG